METQQLEFCPRNTSIDLARYSKNIRDCKEWEALVCLCLSSPMTLSLGPGLSQKLPSRVEGSSLLLPVDDVFPQLLSRTLVLPSGLGC